MESTSHRHPYCEKMERLHQKAQNEQPAARQIHTRQCELITNYNYIISHKLKGAYPLCSPSDCANLEMLDRIVQVETEQENLNENTRVSMQEVKPSLKPVSSCELSAERSMRSLQESARAILEAFQNSADNRQLLRAIASDTRPS